MCALACLAGCGRIGFERQPGEDAGVAAGGPEAGLDAGGDAARPLPDAQVDAASDAAAGDAGRADAALGDAALVDARPVDLDAARDAASDGALDAAPDAPAPDCGQPTQAGVGCDEACVPGCSEPWWDGGWNQRRRISFDNRGQGEALLDFTVALVFDATSIDYDDYLPQGQDLRFVDSDGSTALSHEIERWDRAGTSVVWVKVPRIDPGVDTDYIWMYYGNGAAETGQRPRATWPAPYVGVWHLNTSNARDSSELPADGNASATDVVEGALAGCHQLSVGGAIDMGSPSKLDALFDGGGTFEAWIRAAGFGQGQQGRIAEKNYPGTGLSGWGLMVNNALAPGRALRFVRDFDSASGAWHSPGGSISLDRFHYIAVTYDGSDAANAPTFYIDGMPQPEVVVQTPAGAPVDDAASVFRLGNVPGAGDSGFDGCLDEVRAATVRRSDAWVRAQYLSMTGRLAILEVAQRAP